MGLLTKVAKGVAYGDVSNISVRNVLTEISKRVGGKFTEQEMYDTMDFFDWKCPYTGRDLKKSIEDNDGSYVTDHIYPQNKEWCGLNVKGNLVIVDKKANSAKKDLDIETFLLKDTKVLGSLDMNTRIARLQKIKEFQKKSGYDPDKVRIAVSEIMKTRYEKVREEQEACIAECKVELENIGIHFITAKASVVSTRATGKKSKSVPEIIFYPADEDAFKNELLKTKKAHFVLTYEDGSEKISPWRADKFDASSKLRSNIQSRPFWRSKNTDGLIGVKVYVD